ncbi:MAG: Periplasmic thiol:disulfide interchange protein DsbA [Microgenomates group bacterium GW2011_GWC1_43_11]|uniref:Periplasmic thiol:disulfide interchange protein DsbA n=2 Tax=Candidatus Gottesmaniibacteriota TaxID=1752720 RepID=A0A0G1KY79_9BACT|nr:MAG: Periplasmic thiol:disulfide interchange protein DsbA [Microgenomates group bacterium GW2011_GWC1_43_11]KKT37547.1 MAG: Periplasmic thiol:disulfide interchange protein DsbA [Candidatus Gottesmanbacteria bacterium GW2011_GWB1_44_11c]KKT61297.1 MAG: Periplasmic thiol:disulfide interchange protein DsbA [Candidatus Gottesmanbacteria bacterium GW2011_GWA1_44_24b]
MQNTPQDTPFNTTPVLVTLLILASFFLGSLWTKVQFLEKTNAKTIPSLKQAANPSPENKETPPDQPSPQKAGKKPEITEKDHVRGNSNAKVTLVEYSDMECPFCKRFHPTMLQVMKEYQDKVKWIFRHYPLPFHANAQKEGEASECAAKLGGNEAFWKYIDAILERTTSGGTGFALDKLVPLAVEIGLDKSTFETCLDSGEFTQKVKDHMTSGTAEGVTGTPGTIVIDANGDTQLIPGALPYEQIKPMIDAALQTQ